MCKTVKAVTEFNKKKRGKYGVRGQCRDCTRYIAAAYREDHRAEEAARSRAWYAANADRASVRGARYWAENRLRFSERRAANPHVRWESQFSLRAQGYGFTELVESMESFTREDLVARHGDACFHCGGEWSELDHFPLPVSRGGGHSLDNAVPSCLPCNRRSWREGFAETA